VIRAIRSEFLKFFSTRLWWGMAIGIATAGAGFAALMAWVLTRPTDPAGGPNQAPVGDASQIAISVYTGGLAVGYVLLLTIGVMHIGAEYRHKTISATFLATPRRVRALVAKAVSLVGVGIVYGLISLAAAVLVGAIWLQRTGHDAFPSSSVLRSLALSLVVLGLWALIGLGLGILIPNQVTALLLGVGFAFVIEPIISLALTFWSWGKDHILPYLPSAATTAALDGVRRPDTVQLEWWAALLVLAAYAAVLAGFGIWRAARQDVS